jgi:hypothetical protein
MNHWQPRHADNKLSPPAAARNMMIGPGVGPGPRHAEASPLTAASGTPKINTNHAQRHLKLLKK